MYLMDIADNISANIFLEIYYYGARIDKNYIEANPGLKYIYYGDRMKQIFERILVMSKGTIDGFISILQVNENNFVELYNLSPANIC